MGWCYIINVSSEGIISKGPGNDQSNASYGRWKNKPIPFTWMITFVNRCKFTHWVALISHMNAWLSS